MEESQLEKIYRKWTTDMHFREAFNKNPEQALAQFGFKNISQADLAKIQANLKLKNKDEKLDERINK